MAGVEESSVGPSADHGLDEPIDVLDLPQLYQRPPAEVLLAVLADLGLSPLSWDAASPSILPKRRQISSEGIPAYLTNIIASPLAWLGSDAEREMIWDTASQRLSERSGRSGMGAFSRKFTIYLDSEPKSRDLKETMSPSPRALHLELHEPAMTSDNLGFKTWASSYLLAKRLPRLQNHLMSGPILELGAGTGLVGLAAAAVFGARAVLTDLPEIVPNLEKNVRVNAAQLEAHGGAAESAVLDWSEPSSLVLKTGVTPQPRHSFPCILAADPIYSPDHPRLLCQSIDHHLSRLNAARVILELPLRAVYGPERKDLSEQLDAMGLLLLAQGEEVGFDDWTDGVQSVEVRCWWSVWGWKWSTFSAPNGRGAA